MDINCKYCPKNDGTGNCINTGCPLILIIAEIEEMQSFLETTASDNPKKLIERLTDINVYLARSGKLLADAKAYQDEVVANVYANNTMFLFQASESVAMRFISSQSVTADHLVTWIDRINQTLIQAGDNIKAQIFLTKQNMDFQ